MTWLTVAFVSGVSTLALLSATLGFARLRLVVITVEGVSMMPALEPGERVLVHLSRRRVARGRIVLVQQPESDGWSALPPPGRDLAATPWYLKRVAALAGDPVPDTVAGGGVVPRGAAILLGDHPHSIDSRQHGFCPVEQIIGVVVSGLPNRRPHRRRTG